MKVFMNSALTSLLFLTFFGLKAQDIELISQNNDLLKAFVNKNAVAIRSVQKNSMKSSETISAERFKEFLKLQLISVKLFQTNKAASTTAAYKLREECVDFLSKNSTGSIDYFKITTEEKLNLGAQATLSNSNSYFSENELKAVDAINTKDPGLFNAFTIIVQ